ncbi:MAG TPA: hypothetical protein PL196_06655, partial [Burkholderiaceae bacterium]|nr:hypothetical protein [Burkholderiaceae bacterium]
PAIPTATRMPTARSPRRGRRLQALAAGLAAALVLAACAPDAWKPNPQFSAFLNQVERVCGTTRLGELTISQLMNPGSSLYSAYFVDMTSRFDLGKITVDEYVSGIASTFNTVRDSAGIRCIIAQKNP